MRVCLIIDDYLPDSIKVGAKMIHELAVEFVSRGHDVTVITPHSNMKKRFSMSVLDGVNVCYFRSGSIKNVGKINRVINEALLSHNAWYACKEYFKNNSHDLVIYYSPSIFWGALVSKLKTLWNAPSYLILRDFFPQWVIDNGILKENSLVTKYFRYIEELSYQAADVIALQSPGNLEWFRKSLQTEKPLTLLYNWTVNKPVTVEKPYYRSKYGIEDKVVFFYGGNIGHAQDIMSIVHLAKNMINEKNAYFVLVGDGDEVGIVRAAIKDFQLNNMILLPPVSQDEYGYMLSEFDIGLFSLHKNHTTHNFPGKMLGYMVQKKPILGIVNHGNDLKSVVENAHAGLITISGDDDKFAANALKLMKSEQFRKSMGENSNKLIHDLFSAELAANKILQFYNEQLCNFRYH